MATRNIDSRPQNTPTTPSPVSLPAAGGLLQRTCACGQHTYGGAECSSCRSGSKEKLQRAASNEIAESDSVPPIVHEVLNSPGQPLDRQTRAFMEARFAHNFSGVPTRTASISRSSLTIGPADDPLEQEADRVAGDVMQKPAALPPGSRADFSGVRIHADAQAASSSRAVNAKAYTVGQHIVFGEGGYAPGSSAGQKLLAHELAHTVQQAQTMTTGAARLQRTIGDGHDLTSPRFSLMEDLEAVFDDERTLTLGDAGRGVQAVQQALYDLGFGLRRFGADGTLTRETRRALRSFQRANPPLAVTGDVDRATMEVLDARFASVTLSAAMLGSPWTQSCVNSILCPWSPNTISTLNRRIRVKSFDSIFWDDQEWDGASWIVSPFPGGGYNTGSEIGVLNETCEKMAETLYHEVLHANQPRTHRTTLQRESYAYRIGEEFSIGMGFAGDPSLRSTDARGREFADPAKVDASLQPGGSASYPGVSAAGGGEEILSRVGADRVRVRRANGTVYTRVANAGEKVPGPIRTVNPATHPRSGWVCP